MRPFILAAVLVAAFPVAAPVAADAPGVLKIRAVDGGGYAIEREPPDHADVKGAGIARLSELAPLLEREMLNSQKIDFTRGVKLEGVYTITIARRDGTLAKYQDASDVFVFARPETMTSVQNVTSLDGAVVFVLKIDNLPEGVPEQRLDQGIITLTLEDKAV